MGADRAPAQPPEPPVSDARFLRLREPAFWAYAAIVAATGVYAVSEQALFRRISPTGWALSWLLLAVYSLPVFLAVYFLDLYEREPLSLVFAALVWGAIAATTLAGVANEGWGLVVARAGGPEFASRWTAALTAPWVEETLKAGGVVLIVLLARDEVDDVMDGFVYGAVCGLGFAVVEDVFYFLGVFGGTPSGVLAGFYVRVVSSGLYGHVLFTGLMGMGIAYFAAHRKEEPLHRRVTVASGLFLAAVSGHLLWNSPILDLFPRKIQGPGDWLLIPAAVVVKGLPLVGFVAVAVVLARRREHRWLEAALRSEVGSPWLSSVELGVLLDPLARRRSRRDMRVRAGPRAARLLGRLQREQVNLAMLGARPRSEDDPALERQRELCQSLRDALMAMPGAAPAGGRGAGPPLARLP
ncbi:MAG TPA: PrsW family intramembrane metalloprotease [Actinomycetota bacterium]